MGTNREVQVLDQRLMLTVINWDGGGDGTTWTDAGNWAGDVLPGAADTAVIDLPGSDPTIVFNTTATIDALETKEKINLAGGELTVTTTASVEATATLVGGRLNGGTWTVAAGGSLRANSHPSNRLTDVSFSGDVLLNSTFSQLEVYGATTFDTIHVSGIGANVRFEPGSTVGGNVVFSGTNVNVRSMTVDGTGTLTIPSGVTIETAAGLVGNATLGDSGDTIINQGTIQAGAASRTLTVQPGTFTNDGTLQVNTGTLQVNTTTNLSGTTLSEGIWIASGGTLRLPTGADVVTNDASITIDGVSSVIRSGTTGSVNALANLASVTAAGSLTVSGGKALTTTVSDFSNSGDVTIGATSSFGSSASAGSYSQDSGSTIVDGTLTVPGGGPMNIDAGLLAGSGVVNADVTVGGSSAPVATLSPGSSPGKLDINGDLTMTAFSTTVVEIGGTAVGIEYDQVNVSGAATLDGTLQIVFLDLANGFVPQVGDTFAVIPNSASRTGEFSTISDLQIDDEGLFFDIEYHGNGLDLIVDRLDAGAVTTVDEGLPFDLLATFGDPLANDDYTATIDWGDGSAIQTATVDQVGDTAAGTHHYPDDGGVYTVTVTILADGVTTAVDSRVITVTNVDPTLTVPANQTINEGSLLSLTDIGQFIDPGFDNPTGTPPTEENFTYSIDWGDGSSVDSGAATTDTTGSAGVLTAGSFDGSHTYADNGTYTVSVTVTDDDGGSDTESFSVVVGNVDPTPTVPANQTVDEGTALSLTNIGTFADPGFDNPAGTPTTVEAFIYSINWGDGSAADTGTATIDAPGSAGVLTAGSFDGSHTYADNGTYTVSVTVTDDDGGADTETFDVTVGNVDPTLVVPSNQTVDEGTLLVLKDIAMFTDPGFDNAAATPATAETFTVSVDWGDGTTADSGSATIDTPGSSGSLTAGSFDGSHTYADNGTYTVSVTVADDDGGADTETFDVTVGNVDPTLVVLGNQTIDEGSLLSLTNIGTFTDLGFNNPSGTPATVETFTYSINWGDGSAADTGSATTDTVGSAGVLTGGSFDGSHTYGDNGVYTVTVTVNDDDGGFDTETLVVTVDNAVPAVAAGADQTASEGDSVAIAPTFSDPGALDTHTATIDWGDGSSLESIDPATSPIAGSHIYADNGTYTVTVTVTDDDGEVDSDTIAVTVNNDDPTLTVSANQTIDEGTLLSLTNIGSFTDPGFDNPAATPPTVETFTYSINWGDGTAADTGTATIDTAGSAGVLTAGSFDGTHTYAADGVYTVSVTVTDDDGGVDTETFAVTVNKVDSTLTGFGVNDERENRSAVKTVDLAFNDIDFIGDLLNSLGDGDVETDRVRIERLDLAGNAIGAGEFLSLPAAAFVQNGLKLSIGFGAAGLQQNGVYAVRVDMDGNLSNGFEEARRFHRLLGDVNGDGKVDRTDLAKTRAAYRRPGRYSDADVDGDGDVDRFDLRIYSTLARTRYRDRLLFDRHELDD